MDAWLEYPSETSDFDDRENKKCYKVNTELTLWFLQGMQSAPSIVDSTCICIPSRDN